MMTVLVRAAVGLVAGVILGYVYFGGLWLTVRKLPKAKNPAFLAIASMYGRLALTLLGFFFVWRGDWVRLVCALAGFVAARTMLVHRLGQGILGRGDERCRRPAGEDGPNSTEGGDGAAQS